MKLLCMNCKYMLFFKIVLLPCPFPDFYYKFKDPILSTFKLLLSGFRRVVL